MDVFDNPYFKINKYSLICIGQWTFQKITQKRLVRFIFTFSFVTTLIPQIYLLISAGDDFETIFECIPSLSCILIGFLWYNAFIWKEKQLQNLLQAIKEHWEYWGSCSEIKMLKKNAKYGRLCTLLYAGNMFSALIMFLMMSFSPVILDVLIPLNITQPRQIVYLAKYPFDEQKYFHFLIIYGAITAFCNILVIFSCQSMYAVTIYHACGIFDLVGYRLRHIVHLDGKENLEEEEEEEKEGNIHEEYEKNATIYKDMAISIKWHNHATEYANMLESIFSPVLFSTVGIIVIQISILGIQVINSFGSIAKIIKYGSFASACLINFYCMNIPTQSLLDHSLNVADEMYQGTWYRMPPKVRKSMVLIIQRSQIPCVITVGKIITMDMINFSKLVNTSVSYFMALLSFRQ